MLDNCLLYWGGLTVETLGDDQFRSMAESWRRGMMRN